MTNNSSRIFATAAGFEGGLGLLAWLIGWWLDVPPWQTLHWSIEAMLWGLAATLPLIAALLLIDRYPFGPFRDLKRVVDNLVVPIFRGFRIWQFLILAVLAGVGEELLFRGLLQAGLAEFLQDRIAEPLAPWLALAVASVIFGLMHPITKTYAILCMLVGFYLGWLWIMTDNLLVPIVIHAAYDFVALVYLVKPDLVKRDIVKRAETIVAINTEDDSGEEIN
ncbi:MAG: CPBP family intramembrane metalloprotease [Planctomycetales bacterium]